MEVGSLRRLLMIHALQAGEFPKVELMVYGQRLWDRLPMCGCQLILQNEESTLLEVMEMQNVYGIRVQVIAVTAMVVSVTFTTAIIGHVLPVGALATRPTTCTSTSMAMSPRQESSVNP